MQLGIPTIPTDNLYKFVAIAGLSLIALSLVIAYLFVGTAIDTTEKLVMDREGIKAFVQKLAEYDSLESIQKVPNPEDIREFFQLYLQGGHPFLDLWTEKPEFVKSLVLSAFLWGFGVKYLIGGCILIAFFGLLLSLFGFIMWYIKLQFYQDRIIKFQAIELELKEQQLQEIDTGLLSKSESD